MGAVAGYIVVELATDVLLADVPGGGIGIAYGHRGMEHAAAAKEIMHPSATEEVGHDGSRIGDAIRFGELLCLLGFADVLAIGVVEGQRMSSLPNHRRRVMIKIVTQMIRVTRTMASCCVTAHPSSSAAHSVHHPHRSPTSSWPLRLASQPSRPAADVADLACASGE